MSSKAAVLALLVATAGIASATHCTSRAMELGRWGAEFHDAPNCTGGSPEYFPKVPQPNSLNRNECSQCYTLGKPVSNHVKSFAFSAAEKSDIMILLFDESYCLGGAPDVLPGNTVANRMGQRSESTMWPKTSSFMACQY